MAEDEVLEEARRVWTTHKDEQLAKRMVTRAKAGDPHAVENAYEDVRESYRTPWKPSRWKPSVRSLSERLTRRR